MAGIVGTVAGAQQDLWVVGSRFFFKPDNANSDRIIDLGTINTVSPNLEPSKVDLRDTGSGLAKIIDTSLTDIVETYEITTKNFSRDNLSYLFISSSPAELVEEADNAFAFEIANATPGMFPVGTLIKLYNNSAGGSNQPIYNISAVPSVAVPGAWTGSTFTIVVHDGPRGIVRVTANGYTGTNTGTLTITGNSTAGTDPEPLVNNRRVLRPQEGNLTRLTGNGSIFWARNNFEYQTVREFRCQITPSSANLQTEDYSEFSLTVKALFDSSSSTQPFGRLVAFAGTVI